MSEQLRIRAHIVDALARDLVGPMADDEVLRHEPSRWYLTGFLVPTTAPPHQRIDPAAQEETDAGLDVGDGEEGESEGGTSGHPYLPSSIGCSVLVPPGTLSLAAEVRWGEYTRLSEEETRALRDAERSGRSTRELDPDADGDEEKPLRFRYWRRAAKVAVLDVPAANGTTALPDSGGLVLVVVAEDASAPGLPPSTRAVAVFLVNQRQAAKEGAEDEMSVFQAQLRLRCRGGFQERTHFGGSPHPDDLRNDLQYRNHREWAVGHGVSACAAEVDGAAMEVWTDWLPQARVYRMRTQDDAGVPLGMDEIASLSGVDLVARMEPLFAAYSRWMAGQRGRTARLSPERRATAEGLFRDGERALDRVRDGLSYLLGDATALSAFQLANRAMAMAARRARPDEKPTWRLFQLAFVLLNVRSTAEPNDPDRDTAELLFFPTGGGKTEAYLGLAAFAMLLRRLRLASDRHGGAGVTVILRYTLRLLTLDQLGRAATLTCALELLRREDPKRLGGRRFSVGLWVGRKATANTLQEAARQVGDLRMSPDDARLAPPIPLAGCPWCGTPFAAEHLEVRKDGKRYRGMFVGCASLECAFATNQTPDGIPVVVVDEQIYRELPAFLIGTVDKFAALPWRGATGALFGRVTAMTEDGFYGPHESIPADATPLGRFLPPPSLIIQDELHLITGPLGTMVGLYETAVDHLCTVEGRPPKVIASTATARRATEQVRAIFGRSRTALFPPQSLDDGDTFFAQTDTDELASRLYVGVAAPGRSAKRVAVRVYSALLAAAQHEWEREPAGRANPADTYMTMVNYFNSLRDLGGAQRLISEEVRPLSDRMSRHLAVGQKVSPWFSNRRLAVTLLELTSRQETGKIRDAKAKLAEPFDPDEGRRTDVLLASSMISVGVDIPRLGLMVVNGQPRTVAEYIQASSRVGRATPGLVVTVHNIFRPRDRSHYERFTAFHGCFYRYVEASTVTPFSPRAIERGLAGLTVAMVRHSVPGLAEPRGAERVQKASGIDAKVAAIAGQRAAGQGDGGSTRLRSEVEHRVMDLVADWRDIAKVLAAASQPMAYSHWDKDRTKGTEPLLSSPVDTASPKHDFLEHFRAPTSMRDVEPAVHIWLRGKRVPEGE